MDAVNEWLYIASLTIGFVLLGLSATVGVGLLVAPDRMRDTMRASNQRYSLRKALKPLEIQRDADRLIYRHHRLAGALLIIAASFFLYVYLTDSPVLKIAGWLQGQLGTDGFSGTVAGLGGFLAIVNFLALLLGVTLLVRPSALKPLEAVANRWVSTRQATRHLDDEINTMDGLVWQAPRFAGGLILVGALYALINLFSVIEMTAGR
ncbi:MAG: hypothetical protein R3217_06785 [Gammaproteobacteria bacterium]|nr:hypothetical protein [Gammaproteobacteria bacterium]